MSDHNCMAEHGRFGSGHQREAAKSFARDLRQKSEICTRAIRLAREEIGLNRHDVSETRRSLATLEAQRDRLQRFLRTNKFCRKILDSGPASAIADIKEVRAMLASPSSGSTSDATRMSRLLALEYRLNKARRPVDTARASRLEAVQQRLARARRSPAQKRGFYWSHEPHRPGSPIRDSSLWLLSGA